MSLDKKRRECHESELCNTEAITSWQSNQLYSGETISLIPRVINEFLILAFPPIIHRSNLLMTKLHLSFIAFVIFISVFFVIKIASLIVN